MAVFFALAAGPADFLDNRAQTVRRAAGAAGDQFTRYRGVARLEHILHAELVRINAQFLGQDIHLTFNRPQGLQVTKAAIGCGEDLVGVNGVGDDGDMVDIVGAQAAIDSRLAYVDAVVGVSAAVPVVDDVGTNDGTVLEDPGLDLAPHAGACGQVIEFLLARHAKFNRGSAAGSGQEGDQGLQVDARLASETAADEGDMDFDVRFLDAEAVCHQLTQGERRLRRGPDADPVGIGISLNDGNVGLQGDVGNSREREFVLQNQVGLFQGLLGVTLEALVEACDIGVGLGEEDAFDVLDLGDILVDQNFGFQGVVQVAYRFQDLVLDLDQGDGLLGDSLGRRGDGRHNFTLVTGFAGGDGQFVLHVEADCDVGIFTGYDGLDADQFPGLAGVDRNDPGAGVR